MLFRHISILLELVEGMHCFKVVVSLLNGWRSHYSDELKAERSRVLIPAGSRNFLLSKNVETGSGAHPAFHSLVSCSFLSIGRLERKIDHSSPSSAEVQNEWRCTSTPLICFHDVGRGEFFFLC